MPVAAATPQTAPPPTKRSVRQRLEPETNSLEEASVDDPLFIEEEACDDPDPSSHIMKEMQEEMDESGVR